MFFFFFDSIERIQSWLSQDLQAQRSAIERVHKEKRRFFKTLPQKWNTRVAYTTLRAAQRTAASAGTSFRSG